MTDLMKRLADALREARDDVEYRLHEIATDWRGNGKEGYEYKKQAEMLARIDALLRECADAERGEVQPVAYLYIGVGAYTRGRTIARTPDELGGEIDLYPGSWKRVAALYAAPPAAPEDEHIRDLIGKGASIVRRLYNETPNTADANAAGDWIQYASQLLAAAPTPKGER